MIILPLLLACGAPVVDREIGAPLPLDPCEASGNVCTWSGVPGVAGISDDGLHRLDTWLFLPVELELTADGTAFLPDYENHRVRQVAPDGIVTTVSGTGLLGGAEGCYDGCDLTGPAGGYWRHPTDVVVDPVDPGTLWAADHGRISRLDLAGDTLYTEVDGLASTTAVVADPAGPLYVSDSESAAVWQVDGGVVTVLAGQPGVPGSGGDGGPAAAALLGGGTAPIDLVLDGRTLLLTDGANQAVRAIDLDAGTIELVAGPATGAPFVSPTGLALGADGSLFVADPGSHCVWVVRPDGTVDPFAGVPGVSGFGGDGGPAAVALLHEPYGVSLGPDGAVYVADTMNQVVRRVAP